MSPADENPATRPPWGVVNQTLGTLHSPLTDPSPPPRSTAEQLGGAYALPQTLGAATMNTVASPALTLPGYEILCELGRGGMGVVYRARQTKLHRLVALKMILSGAHADTTDLARFRTEGEAIARLQHPNIVQVYEVGEHEGKPFFSLEFCAGGSLDRKLGGTPLPPKEAARLVETLARAMQAAHEQQVIHRDLKPANVLLAADGTPKVTDFGLAKQLDQESGQTKSGAVMGTPSYMAPEQASGLSKELGPACDVYALGAILYECLTGRPPFKAPTAWETIRQVIGDEPVSVRRLQPCPRDLEVICLRCLQKDPRRRYPRAIDLANDLRRWLDDLPIQARPVGALEQLWRWSRRRPGVPVLVGAFLVILIVLAVTLFRTTYNSYRVLQTLQDRELRLADLRGELRYQDMALTDAALLAAATGDLVWEKRHKEGEARLDAAIAEAVRLAPEASAAAEQIDAANRGLLEMEGQAFALVRQLRPKEAWNLIVGSEYQAREQVYGAAIAKLADQLQRLSNANLDQAQKDAYRSLAWALGGAAAAVAFLIAAGVAVVRTLRRA
jgi:tRNA A-37 threonylcarbamoyl transferase component Bud32